MIPSPPARATATSKGGQVAEEEKPPPPPPTTATTTAPAATAVSVTEQPPTPTPGPPTPDPDDPADIIDMDTFNQILDLDEEDNNEFSSGMAWAYFEQAAATFGDMDSAFADSSLPTLASLGHFLKGSSAALGVQKVQRSCEQIQHLGERRDVDVVVQPDAEDDHNAAKGGEGAIKEDEALARIGLVLARVKTEYAEAEQWLRAYYKRLGV
ncbi:signal transduction histidine kinase [Gautieria morchelliformis]|nr:signal transduction histidine kinase [Gautieria morchelliformis]